MVVLTVDLKAGTKAALTVEMKAVRLVVSLVGLRADPRDAQLADRMVALMAGSTAVHLVEQSAGGLVALKVGWSAA